jgi:hypothetical protein
MKSKAVLSGPTGTFPQVAGEVISNENQLYYRSLNDDELLEALRQSLSGVNATSVRLTQELREHLLPVLPSFEYRHACDGTNRGA